MNLCSGWQGVVPAYGKGTKEYSLTMTEEEYHKAVAGKPIRHMTASATVSGTWTVTFKKNSVKRHKELLG